MSIIRGIKYRLSTLQEWYNLQLKNREVYRNRDNIILGNMDRKTEDNIVNLHYWKPVDGTDNLGDYLSKVIVENYAPDMNQRKIGGGKRSTSMQLVLFWGLDARMRQFGGVGFFHLIRSI